MPKCAIWRSILNCLNSNRLTVTVGNTAKSSWNCAFAHCVQSVSPQNNYSILRLPYNCLGNASFNFTSITLLGPIMPIKLAAPQTSSFHRSPDPLACMWIVEPCSPVKMSWDSIHKLDISLHCCQHPARIFGDGKFFSHREEDLKRKGKAMNAKCCYIQPITQLPI